MIKNITVTVLDTVKYGMLTRCTFSTVIIDNSLTVSYRKITGHFYSVVHYIGHRVLFETQTCISMYIYLLGCVIISTDYLVVCVCTCTWSVCI